MCASSMWYGWWNNLVYTLTRWVLWIFDRFWILYGSLGVGRVPIGFVAPWRFKWLDSQPDSSNMGPVSIDFHDFWDFPKSCHVFLDRYLSCFRPGRPRSGFLTFSVGIEKLRGEKLRRFVVVSPREVPSLPFSWPFKISKFRQILKVPPFCLFQFREFSVH